MSPTTLSLRPRYSGPTADLVDGSWQLQGEYEWIVEGSKAEIDDIARATVGVAERLADSLLLLRFGNSIGHFSVPHLGRLEISSGKCNRRQFEQMLADLLAVAAGLPFRAAQPGALPYDRTVATRQDVLYHEFVYLRYILSSLPPREQQLLPALALILADPHRRFERIRREVPLDQVRRVSPATVAGIVLGRRRLYQARNDLPRLSTLAHSLGGYLPLEVVEPQVISSYDTPENRFVKVFLQLSLQIIMDMRSVIRGRSKQDVFTSRLLADCDDMDRALRPVAHHALWNGIGTMTHVPVSSTILQRRHGYRDVFRHFAKLGLAASIPLDRTVVQDLLEAKDVDQLYELWCFFELVRKVEALLGRPYSAHTIKATEWDVGISRGLQVSWSNGVRLVYNPIFSRTQPHDRFAYSTPLRPDIGLVVGQGKDTTLHLFDAKFRLEKLDDSTLDDAESVGESEEDPKMRAKFKQADLHKMHAYHDAIPSARSVWILYPGSETLFYCIDGRCLKAVEQLGLGELNGVGGLPLVPFEDNTALSQLLATLVNPRCEP